MDELKEIRVEDRMLLDYMLIPVKEYRQLIEDIADAHAQIRKYHDLTEEYKQLVAEYKHDLFRTLGIKDLKEVRNANA